ncbi:sodium:solute symporter family protein [Spongorhabdus nitratireducens]
MISPLWLITTYFCLLIPLCVMARRASRNGSAIDHYLASRSLSFFVLFLTLFATCLSGNTLMGHCGQAYYAGFVWVLCAGLWAASMGSFHLLVPKMRPLAVRHNFVTPGDWLRFRFPGQKSGCWLRQLTAFCLCVAMGNFLFSQLKAAGEIMALMTNDQISYELGVILFAVVILVYDSLGGLRAVAWTDVFQGLIILLGLLLLVIWLGGQSDNLAQFGEQVTSHKPEAALVPDRAAQIKWVSLLLMAYMSVVIYPQSMQRIFAASSHKVLNRSFGLMSILGVGSSALVLVIGWCAISMVDPNVIHNRDQVLPYILELWAQSSTFGRLAANLTLLAVFAAIMSTADSLLLTLVSIFKHDFVLASDRQTLSKDYWIAIVVMGIITAFALNRDITLWRLLEFKLELLIQCFPTFVIALHYRRLPAQPYLAGLVCGLVFLIASLVCGITSFGGLSAGLVGLAVNLMVIFIVSRWCRNREWPGNPVAD